MRRRSRNRPDFDRINAWQDPWGHRRRKMAALTMPELKEELFPLGMQTGTVENRSGRLMVWYAAEGGRQYHAWMDRTGHAFFEWHPYSPPSTNRWGMMEMVNYITHGPFPMDADVFRAEYRRALAYKQTRESRYAA